MDREISLTALLAPGLVESAPYLTPYLSSGEKKKRRTAVTRYLGTWVGTPETSQALVPASMWGEVLRD